MNERIEKLAKEAGYKHPEAVGSCEDYAYFDHEKFAESIIKKCLEQCYYRGMNDELYAGQLKAAAYIEEYFGVEE